MTGWIKIHRGLKDHDVWLGERFTKGQAWVDLMMLATHTDRNLFIRGVEISLKVGDLAYSQVSLAERWRWNPRTVNKFISWLAKRQMVQSKINNITTVISIINYERYQHNTEQSTDQNAERVQSRVQTNKNDKNINNDNKEIITRKRVPSNNINHPHLPLVIFLEEILKTKFTNYPKQLMAVKKMKDAGYEEKEIKFIIRYMAQGDKFFKDKGFDMMTVSNNISRLKVELLKTKEGGEKYVSPLTKI